MCIRDSYNLLEYVGTISRADNYLTITNTWLNSETVAPLKIFRGYTAYIVARNGGGGTIFGADASADTGYVSWLGFDLKKWNCGGGLFGPWYANNDNAWHIYAGTTDGTNGTGFVDDCALGYTLMSGQSPFLVSKLFLGSNQEGVTFSGDLAYLSLYDGRQSDSVISNNLAALRLKMQNRNLPVTTAARVLLFEGDSFTCPDLSINGGYGQLIATNLASKPLVNNAAVSGSFIEGPSNRLAFTSKIAISASPATRTNVISILIGCNDMGNRDTNVFWSCLTNYFATQRANGFKVIAVTIPPRFYGTAAQYNIDRNGINARLRANPQLYDGLADIATNTLIGLDACSADATYYDAPTQHPTAAWHAVVAPIVKEQINRWIP